jgi:hypothetical protein
MIEPLLSLYYVQGWYFTSRTSALRHTLHLLICTPVHVHMADTPESLFCTNPTDEALAVVLYPHVCLMTAVTDCRNNASQTRQRHALYCAGKHNLPWQAQPAPSSSKVTQMSMAAMMSNKQD